MSRRQIEIPLAVALAATLAGSPSAHGAGSNGFIQDNISTAKIIANGAHYSVDISMMATDVEEVFLKTRKEHEDVDLNQPGAVEREIGNFVARRVTMRDGSGAECVKKVDRLCRGL